MKERNIEQYTTDYVHHNFESVMVKYRRKNVLKILSKYNPKNILEVGCGCESIFNYFLQYESFTIIEPSSKFCEIARQSPYFSSKVEIINGFLEDEESLLEKKYDFIICSALLHEVKDSIEFLQKIKMLCNKDTVVLVDVPNIRSFHLLWAYVSGLLENIGELTSTALKLQQNSTFDLESLSRIIKQAGFSIVDTGSYFIKPFNHKKMFDLVQDGYIDEKLMDGLDLLVKFFPDNGSEIYAVCKVA